VPQSRLDRCQPEPVAPVGGIVAVRDRLHPHAPGGKPDPAVGRGLEPMAIVAMGFGDCR
jgi:hypothetical protein